MGWKELGSTCNGTGAEDYKGVSLLRAISVALDGSKVGDNLNFELQGEGTCVEEEKRIHELKRFTRRQR